MMNKKVIIPFDIETAQLVTASETGKVITREGKEVTITNWNSNVPQYPILGKINFIGSPMTRSWTIDGKLIYGMRSTMDLGIEITDEELFDSV